MGFLRRRLVTAALTANAIRPPHGARTGALAFPAGWLAGELAPHLAALTAADTALALARGRAGRGGLAVAAGTALGLGYLVQLSRSAGQVLDRALDESLGPDYVDHLGPEHSPADLVTPWRSLVNPFDLADPRARVDRDLGYNDAGRRGLLDVYRPADRELTKAPVLLQVHGGGWVLGNKNEQGIPLMQHMALRGWVSVGINYRLAGRDPFPAQIVDVKRAIVWVKDHIAEYGGDPDHIVITGGSAGGHLAALAALTPGDPAYQPGFEDRDTSVQACVPHYGVYDLAGSTGLPSAVRMRDEYVAPYLMHRTWADDPELFEAASPVLRIGPDAPDFFVIHGAHDSLVPVEQARLFVTRLRATSRNRVVYAELPGAQHAFDVFPSIRSARVVRAIDRFLTWQLSTRRPEVATS